jgi:hypothetical protein
LAEAEAEAALRKAAEIYGEDALIMWDLTEIGNTTTVVNKDPLSMSEQCLK